MRTENEPRMLLRVEEAARMLGIGRSTIYQLIAANELPGVIRIRNCLRISRTALETWVTDQTGGMEGRNNPDAIGGRR